MANEWVKNMTDAADPKIHRLAALTGHTADAVYRAIVGRWWFWVDQHCKDDRTGLTVKGVNDVLCLPPKRGKMSMADAMMHESIDWIAVDGGEVVVLRFEEHFSKSAKRRAADQKRKARGQNAENIPQKVRSKSGRNVVPELEPPKNHKRNGEIPHSQSGNSGRDSGDGGSRLSDRWAMGGLPKDACGALKLCGVDAWMAMAMTEAAPGITAAEVYADFDDICAKPKLMRKPGALIGRLCKRHKIETPQNGGKLSHAMAEEIFAIEKLRANMKGGPVGYDPPTYEGDVA